MNSLYFNRAATAHALATPDTQGGAEPTTPTQGSRAPRSAGWSGVLAGQGFVIGIDISGSGERAVIADLNGVVQARRESEAEEKMRNPTAAAKRIARMINELLQETGVRDRELLRIGVGFGGPVDTRAQVVLPSHSSEGWEDFPLAQQLEAEFDTPVLLDNDARLAALGEVWFGAGKGCAECDLVYLHWSTGIGGGLVAGGKLLRGSSSLAGEFGHMTVDTGPDALPCRCGENGHLEAYARPAVLLERARQAIKAERPGTRSRLNPDKLTMEYLFSNAAQQPFAALVGETVNMMALVIGDLITCINPSLVVIGGRAAREAKETVPRIAELARSYAMPLSAQAVSIETAYLGEDSTVLGAVALALESLR